MLLAMKTQQQSYSGLRSPGRSCSAYLCTDSECTNRTDFIYLAYCKKRTLAVLWPYRPYDCTDSATVTDLQTVCAKATGSFHPTYQRAALERQCITEISVISFSLFQNLQVRCFVFSFSVWIFLALFLSYLSEYSYQRNWINKRYFIFQCWKRGSFDSSVGRAEDCRVNEVILRSLVRIRLEGMNFSPFSRAVEYIVPALRSSYWFREISDFVFLL